MISKDHQQNLKKKILSRILHIKATKHIWRNRMNPFDFLNIEMFEGSRHSQKCVVFINLQIMLHHFNRLDASRKRILRYKMINFSWLSKSFVCLPQWIYFITINGVNVKYFVRFNGLLDVSTSFQFYQWERIWKNSENEIKTNYEMLSC